MAESKSCNFNFDCDNEHCCLNDKCAPLDDCKAYILKNYFFMFGLGAVFLIFVIVYYCISISKIRKNIQLMQNSNKEKSEKGQKLESTKDE